MFRNLDGLSDSVVHLGKGMNSALGKRIVARFQVCSDQELGLDLKRRFVTDGEEDAAVDESD